MPRALNIKKEKRAKNLQKITPEEWRISLSRERVLQFVFHGIKQSRRNINCGSDKHWFFRGYTYSNSFYPKELTPHVARMEGLFFIEQQPMIQMGNSFKH